MTPVPTVFLLDDEPGMLKALTRLLKAEGFNVQAFTSSFIGRLIVFGYTWALLHHLLSGLRHFIWDLGYGFKPNEREALTWAALIGGISLTVLLWIAAYVIGGGR